MGELRLGDTAFDHDDRGRGPLVILVHGSAGDRRSWQGQTALLAGEFRVVDYSRRHHGANKPIDDGADYAMEEHVEDLIGIIESLDGGPAHLVGHSYGGYVSLMVALRRPDLIRSLVLIEPPVVPLYLSDPPNPTELVKLLATRPRTAAALIRFAATGLIPATKAARDDQMEKAMTRFGRAVLGPDAFERLSPERWQQALDNNIRAEYLGSGFPALDPRSLKEMDRPTLLVTGDRSPGVWTHLTARLDELLPKSTRATIADASHMVHEDNPQRFNDLVIEFLGRQR